MVTPTTSYPCSRSRAAATEESTPPDMATSTRVMAASGAQPLAERIDRERPQRSADALDDPGDDRARLIDPIVGGRPSDAQAERPAGLLLRVAHGREDVADLARSGRAGRAGRAGDALEVERQGDRLTLRVAHDDREMPGQSIPRVAGELDPGQADDRLLEPVAQAPQSLRHLEAFPPVELVRDGHPDRPGHVLRPGTTVALLRAALGLGEQRRPVPDPQRPGALGPLELVGAEADQVRVELLHLDRQGRG